jgi:hypothetical protein
LWGRGKVRGENPSATEADGRVAPGFIPGIALI